MTTCWQPWLMFFMRALQQQKRRLTAKVKREKGASGATWRWSLDIARPAVIVGS